MNSITAWTPDGKRAIKIPAPVGRGTLKDDGRGQVRGYSNEEDKYIRENYEYGQSQAIADFLGRSRSSIHGRAHRLGLSKSQGFGG